MKRSQQRLHVNEGEIIDSQGEVLKRNTTELQKGAFFLEAVLFDVCAFASFENCYEESQVLLYTRVLTLIFHLRIELKWLLKNWQK